ncbi:protease pro-enzyme activation domain-containing protein [Actinoplanes sp. NPDC051513]|uniref:S53 family peptidase n=1 Tax=Actinoplanes sp. NPDC051513 TaxID=3363908 RepID=UPI00379687D6
MKPLHPWHAAAVALAGGVLIVPGGAAIAAPPQGRVVLPSPIAGQLGEAGPAADPNTELHLRVFLAGQDPAGLARAAMAAATPGTPAYARYLSPARYRQRFAATDAQIAKARDWLTGQGMTVTASNAHYLAADATVAEAGAAFGATFRVYEGDWSSTVAPGGDVSVPASFGRDIVSVDGLTTWIDNGPKKAAAPRKAAADTYPCSHWWAEHKVEIPDAYGHPTAPTQVCGYTPQQMRQAYGVTGSPYTGKGATVAVVLDGRSPTMEADANRFFAAHGVAGFAPGQYSENLPADFDCSEWPDGDNPEEALDVETIHIIAPDAKMVFVSDGCKYDGYSQLDAYYRIVDDHLADVVTDSWPLMEDGVSPALIAGWELMLQQGAIEGIGMNFASGDYGNETGKGEVPFPTSDPWATGVGGTSLALGRDGRRLAEWGWGDTVAGIGPDGYTSALPGTLDMGAGGGLSAKLAEPAYQRGVVPDRLAGGSRVVPDVAADAGTYWLVGYTAPDYSAGAAERGTGPFDTGPDPGPPVYGEHPSGGGTSGSSPILAALQADAKQATGHALGFVNPALYRLARTGAFHDIRPVDPADPPIMAGVRYCMGEAESEPCLTTLGDDGSLKVTPGYDTVTGIGTPSSTFVTAFRGLRR